jgi:hypothetical protein
MLQTKVRNITAKSLFNMSVIWWGGGAGGRDKQIFHTLLDKLKDCQMNWMEQI